MENNKKFTEEDIKKIEKTLQYIFTPVKTITSVAPSEFMKGKGEAPNNDFAIKIDGEETRIFAVANVEGLAKNIWRIAYQICKALDIKENDPIYDFIRDRKTPRYDKIEELLKTIK